MSEPLREGINKLVLRYLQKKLETGEAIDVVEMTHEMAQSLIDMIMEQEQLHQAPLLASVIASLGDEYLQRSNLFELPDKRAN
jgi:DNA-binding protein Fis